MELDISMNNRYVCSFEVLISKCCNREQVKTGKYQVMGRVWGEEEYSTLRRISLYIAWISVVVASHA